MLSGLETEERSASSFGSVRCGQGITMTPPRRPFPAHDDLGMQMTIDVLEKVLRAGRHEASTKFSNVRKIALVYKPSALGTASSTFILREEKKRLYSTQSPH
jgi:hypothetical protein